MTHAILTGPIRRTLTLADGTEVDVRPDVVYVDTPEQAAEVADLIGQHHADRGHPWHDADDPFEYDAEQSAANLARLTVEQEN
jgi:hypothetical protein